MPADHKALMEIALKAEELGLLLADFAAACPKEIFDEIPEVIEALHTLLGACSGLHRVNMNVLIDRDKPVRMAGTNFLHELGELGPASDDEPHFIGSPCHCKTEDDPWIYKCSICTRFRCTACEAVWPLWFGLVRTISRVCKDCLSESSIVLEGDPR